MKKGLPFLIVMIPLVFGFTSHLMQKNQLPSGSNNWFSSSGVCVLCHDTHSIALRDDSGNDVSPVSQWRSTMLANASKDPFWRAKVKHEGLENPSHKEGLENVCTRCHAPMGMINAFMNVAGNYTLEHLYQDELGKDGISCTVCHQISDFSDPAFSGNFDINQHKEIYGPFPNPVVQQMLVNTGYTPVHNDQINNSRLCGSCHTLFTHSVDETGAYTGSVFVEQALYHEWENSVYPAQNTGCQTCHMPRLEEAVKITSRPLFLEGRQPFGQHTLTGGNMFMLTLLRDNHEQLELHSGTEFLQRSIDRTKKMLTEETVDLTIEEITTKNDTVFVRVSILNKAGHKFPTGFPSRRAYLECLITNNADTIFHSGKPGSAALAHFDTDSFEPHYEVINDASQVQIYEFVMGDTNGKVTTILERAHIPLKDNRMVPQGFRADHQNYDTVQVVGRATIDADYFTASGYERITYAIPLSQVGTEYTVKVALHYETVPESWLQQLFDYVNEDDDIKQFKLMYESSDNTPVLIASDIKSIMTTSIQNHEKIHLRVYPNPSNGNIWIDGLEKNVSYTVYTTDGKQIRSGTLAPGSNFLSLDLPAGCYFFVVSPASNRFTTRLVVKR